jgi:hypothetical protein
MIVEHFTFGHQKPISPTFCPNFRYIKKPLGKWSLKQNKNGYEYFKS